MHPSKDALRLLIGTVHTLQDSQGCLREHLLEEIGPDRECYSLMYSPSASQLDRAVVGGCQTLFRLRSSHCMTCHPARPQHINMHQATLFGMLKAELSLDHHAREVLCHRML